MKNTNFIGTIIIVLAVISYILTSKILDYKLKLKKAELNNKTVLELSKNLTHFQIETLKLTHDILIEKEQ